MRFFKSWSKMEIGDTVIFYRTFSEGDVSNFTGITGDFNPIHMDPLIANSCGFKDRVVPGLLTASMLTHAGGTLLPEPYPASGMSFRFKAPVYIGERICAQVTVTKKDMEKNKLTMEITCTNPMGQIVLVGEVSGKIMPIYGKNCGQPFES